VLGCLNGPTFDDSNANSFYEEERDIFSVLFRRAINVLGVGPGNSGQTHECVGGDLDRSGRLSVEYWLLSGPFGSSAQRGRWMC